jgi:hypothetical protein
VAASTRRAGGSEEAGNKDEEAGSKAASELVVSVGIKSQEEGDLELALANEASQHNDLTGKASDTSSIMPHTLVA